jgi:hypothetical protein
MNHDVLMISFLLSVDELIPIYCKSIPNTIPLTRLHSFQWNHCLSLIPLEIIIHVGNEIKNKSYSKKIKENYVNKY